MIKLINKRKHRLDKIFRFSKSAAKLVWFAILEYLEKLSGKLRRQMIIVKLKKADIILACPRTLKLSPIAMLYRLLLGSHYVHSMLYIGKGKIIHTTSKYGVVIGRLPNKIYKRNRYTIFRVKNINNQKRKQIISEALKFKDKKLDYIGMLSTIPSRMFRLQKNLLDYETDRIWCSKLVYLAYLSAGVELLPSNKAGSIISDDLSQNYLLVQI